MNLIDIFNKQKKLRISKVSDFFQLMMRKEKYSLPSEVRIKKICKRNGKSVFLVNGFKIRKSIDIDFTMGGHGLRYVYIPIDEIWIDNSNENECEEVLVHELEEFNLMKNGVSYNKAHDKASLVEVELRNTEIISQIQKESFISQN